MQADQKLKCVNTALQLMQRVQITGQEVPAYINAVNWLTEERNAAQREAEAQKKEE